MNALVIRPKAKIAATLRLPGQRRERENSPRSAPEPGKQVSGSSDPESPTSDQTTAPESPSSVSNQPSMSRKRSGKQRRALKSRASAPRVDHGLIEHDIEEYYHAKRKLKKAVLECYRCVTRPSPSDHKYSCRFQRLGDPQQLSSKHHSRSAAGGPSRGIQCRL